MSLFAFEVKKHRHTLFDSLVESYDLFDNPRKGTDVVLLTLFIVYLFIVASIMTMNVINCARVTSGSLLRSIQAHRCAGQVVPQRCRYEWHYNSKEGVPRQVITMLTQDYDFSQQGIKTYLEKSRRMAVKEDHKFKPERHSVLGPDLATAHFLVKRGAKVKFVGRNTWFKRDEAGNMYLPNQYIPGMHLEAIDATGIQMSYVAFDNMIQLEHLRYLNVSRCINLDDWCLARMHQFQDTLEFLDISDCWEVTHNGLACLHTLKKLQGLKLSGLTNVHNTGLIILLLEDFLPQCTIFGVEPEKLEPPSEGGDSQLTGRVKAITQGDHADNDNSKCSVDSVTVSDAKS